MSGMDSAPDTREGHLTALRDQAMTRLDAGDSLGGVLEFVTTSLRSCTGTYTALTAQILDTEGKRYARDGDVPNMRKLITLLTAPVPVEERFVPPHGSA